MYSAVELEILDEVKKQGRVVSVFNLAICQLGRDLSNVHNSLRRLEARGEITITRQGRGMPLIIEARNGG